MVNADKDFLYELYIEIQKHYVDHLKKAEDALKKFEKSQSVSLQGVEKDFKHASRVIEGEMNKIQRYIEKMDQVRRKGAGTAMEGAGQRGMVTGMTDLGRVMQKYDALNTEHLKKTTQMAEREYESREYWAQRDVDMQKKYLGEIETAEITGGKTKEKMMKDNLDLQQDTDKETIKSADGRVKRIEQLNDDLSKSDYGRYREKIKQERESARIEEFMQGQKLKAQRESDMARIKSTKNRFKGEENLAKMRKKLVLERYQAEKRMQNQAEKSEKAHFGRRRTEMQAFLRYTKHWATRFATYFVIFKTIDFMKDLTLGIIDAARQMDQLSKITGFSTEALSGLDLAAKTYLITTEQLQRALAYMGKSISLLGQEGGGKGRVAWAYRQLGLSFKDLKDLKPEDQLNLIADRFSKLTSASTKAGVAIAVFERTGREFIPIIENGSAGIRKFNKDAKDMGAYFEKDFVDSVVEVGKQIEKLKKYFQGVGIYIMKHLTPILNKWFEAVFRNMTNLHEHAMVQAKKDITSYVKEFMDESTSWWDWFNQDIKKRTELLKKAENVDSDKFLDFWDTEIRKAVLAEKITKEEGETFVKTLHNKYQTYKDFTDFFINTQTKVNDYTSDGTEEQEKYTRSVEDGFNLLSSYIHSLQALSEHLKTGKELTREQKEEFERLAAGVEIVREQYGQSTWVVDYYIQQIKEQIKQVDYLNKNLWELYRRYILLSTMGTVNLPALNVGESGGTGEEYLSDYLPEGALEGKAEQFSMTNLDLANKTGNLWDQTAAGMESAWGQATSAMSQGMESLGGKSGIIGEMIMGVFRGIAQAIVDVINTFERELSDAFYRMFEEGQSFSESMSEMWENMKKAFKRALADMISAAITSLSGLGVIRGLASAVAGGGMFAEGGYVQKGPGSLPKIPQAAEGMITHGTKPIPAILHPNEVVLPRDYIKDFFGTMAERLFSGMNMMPSRMLGTGGGGNTVNLYVGAGNFDDPAYWRKLYRQKIKPAMQDDGYGRV